jgi:DNA polymerase V
MEILGKLKSKDIGAQYLPLYSGELACGLFGISEDFIENYLSLDEKFAKNRESTFYIRASGDSMLPEIKNGDILIVDRSLKVINRSIVAVFYNGTPMCKQIIFEPNKKILRPLNRAHKDLIVTGDDELTLFGIVIGLARDLY